MFDRLKDRRRVIPRYDRCAWAVLSAVAAKVMVQP